eukprot:Opistho-1_new@25834
MLGGVDQLACEAVFHTLLTALDRSVDHPAHCQRGATRGAHFDRHLVGGTADATRLDLNGRRDIVECGLQERRRLGDLLLVGDLIERAVHDLFGDGFLAVFHDHVDELGHQLALEHRAVDRGYHQDRAVHLRGAGDHVLDVVGVARAVDVCV